MKTWTHLLVFVHGKGGEERSCWKRGVMRIAAMMLEEAIAGYKCGNSELPATWAETEKILLNGANDWEQYVFGGCALVYDEDIAKTLLTPTDLKRWYNSSSDCVPGKQKQGMTMMDLEVRAARQAAHEISRLYRQLKAF